MQTDKQFVNTLEDIIFTQGAMDRLVSDSTQVEITGRVKDILQVCTVGNWSSELHQQHPNHVERKYQHVKSTTNCMIKCSVSPANT